MDRKGKKDVLSFINNMKAFISRTPWYTCYYGKLLSLERELDNPCVLAVGGRVKEGKSSLINALLGKDLAVVMETEATATVNMFRKRRADDGEHSLKVLYKDGSTEFKDLSFMDSLQGKSKEVLERAKKIKWVEYILDDIISHNITLVDTPGTDAITEENVHENTTRDYLIRKERSQTNTEETTYWTSHADAVIYMLGATANSSNASFINDFKEMTGGKAVLSNSIGIMGKIDQNLGIVDNRDSLADDIKQNLKDISIIIPISTYMWKVVNNSSFSRDIKGLTSLLQTIDNVDLLNYLLKDIKRFLIDNNELCEILLKRNCSVKGIELLPLEYRQSLCDKYEWTILTVIIHVILKYNYSSDDVIKELYDIAGINKLNIVLKEQFFSRAESIKCSSILSRVSEIMFEIKNGKLDVLSKVAHQKKHTLTNIDHLGLETQDWIKKMYLAIPSEVEIKKLKEDFCELLLEFERLNYYFLFEYQMIIGRRTFEQYKQLFTSDECHSLEKMFDKKTIELRDYDLWNYWNYVSQNDTEPKRVEVAKAVISKLNVNYKQ